MLNKINAAINADEQQRLNVMTAGGALAAQILPIRSVGVQVSLSTSPFTVSAISLLIQSMNKQRRRMMMFICLCITSCW